jgi:hypothetical protein
VLAPQLHSIDSDPTDTVASLDIWRATAAAGICAALRVLDHQRYAARIRQGESDIPAIRYVLRAADVQLVPDDARLLVDLTAQLIASLRPISAAAEVLAHASCITLAERMHGGALIVGHKVALWPAEIVFPAVFLRRMIESANARSVAVVLAQNAADHLDHTLFSAIGALPGRAAGLLHRAQPLAASSKDNAMHRDLDRLTAALGGRVALLVAGPKQAEAIRRKFAHYRVRASEALPNVVVAIADNDDAVIAAGFGPLRATASVRPSRDRVEVSVRAPMAWAPRAPNMVSWIRGTNW